MITQTELKELLRYDPETGYFICLVQRKRAHVGDVAGCPWSGGYWGIKIKGARYLAHRLAWFYMKGVWPKDEIDHKDTDPSNNRWKNLREATHAINQQNQRKAHKDSKTGFLGVTPCGKGFRTQIGLSKKKLPVFGTYPTPELAHAAYLKAKREKHPGCTI